MTDLKFKIGAALFIIAIIVGLIIIIKDSIKMNSYDKKKKR